MLVILVFGHMIPLVLNFETLFLGKRDSRSQLLRIGGWFEVNEMMVRIVTMVAFLLQFRLLQLTWSARLGGEKGENNQKASWVAEKKALFVSIPLYIVGVLVALFLNVRNNKSDNTMYSSYGAAATIVVHQQNSLWGALKSYGGLVLDGFLFPKILLNMFRISGEKPLSRSFYIGTTFVRLLPRAYDLYRAHNNAHEQFEESYIFANPSADYYSTAWDVGISCGGVAFAIIIYLQKRLGGRFFLPRRFREAEAVYEKVPVLNYVMNPTIVDSLISGSLESLSSSTDLNYFKPVWILGFSETSNYKYSGDSGNGCDSGINFPIDQSLSLPPRTFCSSQSRIDAVLKYKKKKNCTVLGDGIEYLPRVMSMVSIQCSEDERKVRFLIQFGKGSYMVYDQPFEPNSTLVAEASWDAEKSQLCIVACRVLKDDHVGDCSIRMSLRYPALWSIKNREAIVGQIWTNKTVNEEEGVYDEETGNLRMVGCTKLSKDDQRSKTESMDCEVVVKFQYQRMNSKNRGQIKGTIESMRKEIDALYFAQLEVSASTYYTEDARDSIWRMDLEIAMVLISNTLACVFVVLQIFYVRKNPGLLPLASLVMLVILDFGHMILLVLNFETLFLGKRNSHSQLLWSGGWFEGLKLMSKSDNSMYSSYGVAATIVVHRQNSLWGALKSYGGLVLDGFLFPLILLNMFRISGEKPLSHSFYIGTTFVRLLPHAYDLYRAHNYAREQFEESYIYANPSADYYSTAWDVGIYCGGVAFAIIIYLQQRFGGRFFLPRRFREAEAVYEKVPVGSRYMNPFGTMCWGIRKRA
ncbi:hypothetical protein LOK49_Contig148G00002 [Camellia lanceoleosa]|nr:hypothetical protein LOK49_Contig148G00002 [Camellia lanceoleosa]